MSEACLILGDSIALGLAAALQMMTGTQCDVRARTGVGSGAVARMVPDKDYSAVVVSTGTNDEAGARLSSRLAAVRQRLRARQVVWIYPRSPARGWQIHGVALAHGDAAMGLATLRSRDGIHPDDYRAAALLVLPRLSRAFHRSPTLKR